nr:MAG TPA: hypothetical protein [Caudoviricetes sp.]
MKDGKKSRHRHPRVEPNAICLGTPSNGEGVSTPQKY